MAFVVDDTSMGCEVKLDVACEETMFKCRATEQMA